MLPLPLIKSLRAEPGSRIVYLNNPKAGCSSIKTNLWKILSPATFTPKTDVHTLDDAPFTNALERLDWLEDARIFTFVRNPHARILSAYLNKIHRQAPDIWPKFARRFGLDLTTRVSFAQFIEIIHASPPERLDEHFRPQYLNILHPFIRPNFLGSLEHIDTQLPAVLSRFTGTQTDRPERRSGHGTGADTRLADHFADPGIRRRVRDLYAGDFDRFGYDDDLSRSAPNAPEPEFSEHRHPALAALAAYAVALAAGQDCKNLIGRIDRLCADRDDPAIAAWILNARLENAARQSGAGLWLVRNNLDAILSGPDYLRRTAARIAIGRGDWDVGARIATVSARR